MAILHTLAPTESSLVTLQRETESNSSAQRTCAVPCSFSLFFKVCLSEKFGKLTNEPTQNEKNKTGMYSTREEES
jgi:hypothetical protein